MTRSRRPVPAPFDMGVLVRLDNVDAWLGRAVVLSEIDFEIEAGEVAFIAGPTASGKSSFLHLLRLALPPHEGHARILGADAMSLSEGERAKLKRRIGYVAENPTFVEAWSAFENIALPLRLAGRGYSDYARDVEELVEFVGLGPAAAEPAHSLSAAERRRAAIARALAPKPDLILADEPTAGLAPDAARRVIRLLGEMRRVGAGVVVATQDQSLADATPATHWRLDHGRLRSLDHPAGAEGRMRR
jgi:cell division transport system ATP-binding protein